MNQPERITRRAMLARVAIALSMTSGRLPAARGGPRALLQESEPAARAVHYVENASASKEAAGTGATCASCSLYSASSDSDGSCTLFKDKLVKAAGWCTAWSGL